MYNYNNKFKLAEKKKTVKVVSTMSLCPMFLPLPKKENCKMYTFLVALGKIKNVHCIW